MLSRQELVRFFSLSSFVYTEPGFGAFLWPEVYSLAACLGHSLLLRPHLDLSLQRSYLICPPQAPFLRHISAHCREQMLRVGETNTNIPQYSHQHPMRPHRKPLNWKSCQLCLSFSVGTRALGPDDVKKMAKETRYSCQ